MAHPSHAPGIDAPGNSHLVDRSENRSIIGRLFDRLQTWNLKRQAIRELNQLDDLLLTDVGIERGDIASVVEGLLERRGPEAASHISPRRKPRLRLIDGRASDPEKQLPHEERKARRETAA